MVIFLSDGLDNVPESSGEPRTIEILDAVGGLVEEASKNGVGHFVFNTYMPMLEEDEAALIDLLYSIASMGHGEFRIFEAAEDINFINTIEIIPVTDASGYRVDYSSLK